MSADQEHGTGYDRPQESERPEVRTTAETTNGTRPTDAVDTTRVPPSTSEAEARNTPWPGKKNAAGSLPELEPHPGFSWTSLATSAVLALLFGGLGAWGFERFLAKPTPPPEPATAQGPVKPPPPPPTDDKQLNALSKQVDDLRDQVSRMHDQILAESKNQPEHDIKALTNRVETLESQIEPDSGPSTKMDELNNHISSLDKSMETLRGEIIALRDGAGSGSSTTRHVTAKPPTTTDVDNPDLGENFTHGVEQFRKKQYADALKSFQQAQTDHPDDARVWYYSALSEGFANRDWTGKAADLVTKGIEHEREGSPSPATIDDAFSSLTSATGKDWLAGYRKRAR